MEPFLYHVFVCDQKKPEGMPCCSARGSGDVIEALRNEIVRQGMIDEVQLTVCGSLGLCERGPNMVVYPEGVWYCGVGPEDVPEIVRSHFKEGTPVERLMRTDTSQLRSEILSNRQKAEAARRAHDASGAPPDELTQVVRGFQESRVVLTAIELDIFSKLGNGATAASVATGLDAHPRSTEMLLNALTAMGLLTKKNGIFFNSKISARYLSAGSQQNAREGLMHTVHLWPRWSTLTDCVLRGTAVVGRDVEERSEDKTRAFIAAMDRNAAERVPLVIQAVGLEGVRRMLDVGGGSGAYAIAFARAAKELRVEILDIPGVIPLTQDYIDKSGLAAQIKTRPGDLRTDSLGTGFDLVFVSAICHMLDPEENRDLIQRCHRALAPKGRLVVQDFILEPDKTSPQSATLFALNMLVGTRGGSSYSRDEYTDWMRQAAFQDVKHIRLPGPSSLMIGTRA
jgi:(2Fe-2S) ferredoxin/SAM-dependent methyltransferase